MKTVLLLLMVMSTFLVSLQAASYRKEFVDQVQNYPNIISETKRCLPIKGNYRSASTFVCDPDQLLSVSDINSLNDRIQGIKRNINRDTINSCDSDKPRPTIAIALVNEMKIGSVSQETVLNHAAVFSYYLFDAWKLATECSSGNDKIVLFYSKTDGSLYAYAGEELSRRLPSKKIIDVAVKSKPFFNNNIAAGLTYVLDRYKNIFTNRDGNF